MESLLVAREVAKSYGAVRALKSVDLDVQAGETHALLGANGAGKSTFVKIITGVIDSDAGVITFDGTPLDLTSPTQGYERGIATVFQDPALVPDLTILDNFKLTGTDADKVRTHLEAMGLGDLDLDEKAADIPLPFLRMLDLARSLSHDPKLLVLDEITAALPKDLAERVFDVMAQLRSEGRSVLFISHRLEEVIEHCTMCTVFRDGHTVASFVPKEGGEQRIVASMLGSAADRVRAGGRRRAAGEQAPARISVRNLSVTRELDDVSFDIHPGEVLGVVALEGQGQGALFECLAGQRRAASGTISVDGTPLKAHHPADAISKGIVLVPADRTQGLLPRRPIRESIALPLRARIRNWGPFSMRKENEAVDNVIERLSIDTRAAAQARRLSGGNQQKLTIARWLAGGFSTLLLFDPTRGIDIGTKHQIYDLTREVADEGAAVLMYTSELVEVNLVCDRVIVLYGGGLVAELPADATDEVLLSAMHGFVDEEVVA